jgi:hypothetical protein
VGDGSLTGIGVADVAGKAKSGGSMAQMVVWAAFIALGWLVFAYLAFATPGGLPGAWASIRALPLLVQLVLWLLFLPWMIALWIAQTGWPGWLRVLLVVALLWVTYSMAFPPLFQALRDRNASGQTP